MNKKILIGFFVFYFVLFGFTGTTTELHTDVIKPEPIKHIEKSYSMYYDIPISNIEQDNISKICKYYGIKPLLIYQMMSVESNFNRNAYSATGDVGILQVNEKYFDYYAELNTFYYEKLRLDYSNYNDLYVNVITSCNAITYWKRHSSGTTLDFLSCYNQGFNPTSTTYAEKVLNTIIKLKTKEVM